MPHLYQLCLATGILYGNLPSVLTSLYDNAYFQTIFYALYSTFNIALLFYFFYKSSFFQHYIIDNVFQIKSFHWEFYFFLGLFNEIILYCNDLFFQPFYVEDFLHQQCVAHYYSTNRFYIMPLFVFLCALVYEHYRIHMYLCVHYMNLMVHQQQPRRTRSNSPFAVVDNILE